MKKRTLYALILIVSLALLIAACGTVLAYMFRSTEIKTNQFTPAKVSCQVHETTDAAVTEKTSVRIQNTGNINAYLRIRFVSYWVRATQDGKSEIVSKPSVMPAIKIADGWIEGDNYTYFYSKPVSPGSFTDELLDTGEIIRLKEDDGYQQVIEVFAEAIQSEPASSVTKSWHVTLDANGNIENVS